MAGIEKDEILRSPELASLLEQVNQKAEKLNMEFEVTTPRTGTNNGNGLQIVWKDKLIPKEAAGNGEYNATGLLQFADKDDIMGALHLMRNVVATAVERSPTEKEDSNVMNARLEANKIFIKWGKMSFTMLVAALGFYFFTSPTLLHLMMVSVSAVLATWSFNEWRLTHKKEHQPGHPRCARRDIYNERDLSTAPIRHPRDGCFSSIGLFRPHSSGHGDPII